MSFLCSASALLDAQYGGLCRTRLFWSSIIPGKTNHATTSRTRTPYAIRRKIFTDRAYHSARIPPETLTSSCRYIVEGPPFTMPLGSYSVKKSYRVHASNVCPFTCFGG